MTKRNLLDASDALARARGFANLLMLVADAKPDDEDMASVAYAADAILDDIDKAKALIDGKQPEGESADNDD